MKFKITGLLATFLFLVMMCGCSSGNADESENKSGNVAEVDKVEEILNQMTLTEKVGQMVMMGVYGTDMNEDIQYMFNQFHIGGVILFDRNMDNKEQVKKFVDRMQNESNEKLPLFIAIDEEGGRVARMKNSLTVQPSQEDIGLTGDPNNAFTYAKLTAEELKTIGVNVNFAPVADVGSKDTRSFGSDAKTVAEFVSQAAKGYESTKFFYCLKHFPGIGRAKTDPHLDISNVEVDLETLEQTDFVPFKKIIDEQDNSKFMIMVSHLKYDAIDPENPGSLSRAVMTDLLRDKMKFKGVLITDDLQMGAIKKSGSDHEDMEYIGFVTAEAGADIVLICHDYKKAQDAYMGILYAARDGRLSEERINESVRRIIKMKLALQK